jgi:hypothetical protein
MAETTDREKTLEMRVAELEDKLKGLQVTEEEMRAFNKVASLMGLMPQAAAMPAAEATAAAPTAAGAVVLGPGNCVISQCVRTCVISQCVRTCVISQCVRTCVISQCVRTCVIQDCINECGGGCAPGGGFFGGGFGGLGG